MKYILRSASKQRTILMYLCHWRYAGKHGHHLLFQGSRPTTWVERKMDRNLKISSKSMCQMPIPSFPSIGKLVDPCSYFSMVGVRCGDRRCPVMSHIYWHPHQPQWLSCMRVSTPHFKARGWFWTFDIRSRGILSCEFESISCTLIWGSLAGVGSLRALGEDV